MKLDAARCELISDVILALLVVVPVALIIALSFDCGPWDEGHQVSCTIPGLGPLPVFFQAMMLLTAFGGFIIYLPIVLIAYINSTLYKLRAWKASTLSMRSMQFIIWLIASCLAGLLVLVSLLSLL